ncbi:MAG: glycosyltransferase, family [Alphaproteobacteria bacterium]|nr:glycosyltransferase, family [Alphaproteobacteria bacterium]
MAHLAVIAPPLAGHLAPLAVLGHKLVERGHRVTFVNQADAAGLIRSESIGFVTVGAHSHPPRSLEQRIARMSRLNGPIGIRGLIRDVAAFTDMLCRELPARLHSIGADAVIADQMEPAGGLVADYLGLPLVSVASALPINREPGLPPPYLGWRFDDSPGGMRRNAGGWRVADWLMRPANAVISRHAAAFRLPPRRRAEDCLSPTLELAQAVAGLDFPRRELPAHFHYLGGFREETDESFDWPEDGRPLAFCSLGTLQGGRAGIFRRVAKACQGLGLRLVIAHGGRLSDGEVGDLPGDTIVRDFVPQRAVLARSSVAISHCGLNTVVDALACGVPILGLPLAFEQPATAARLAYCGAGLVLSHRAGSRRIRRSLEALLGDSRHSVAAGRIQDEIARAGGAGRAADLIEASLS